VVIDTVFYYFQINIKKEKKENIMKQVWCSQGISDRGVIFRIALILNFSEETK